MAVVVSLRGQPVLPAWLRRPVGLANSSQPPLCWPHVPAGARRGAAQGVGPLELRDVAPPRQNGLWS
jgi:hypothetical protein